MRPGLILPILFLFVFGKLTSQTNKWTWIKGSSTVNAPNNFGIQGVPSSSNTPSGRQRGVSWVDKNNNFWYFGGLQGVQTMNDLWKFDIKTNTWIWIKGNAPARFGIKGFPDSLNNPPGKDYPLSWVDNTGDLWLFGGKGDFYTLNDLWRYSIATNQWTWMAGDTTITTPINFLYISKTVFGTKGIAAPQNTPGGRLAGFSWTDVGGNLWMFGGEGDGGLNELWRFNVVSGMWTWMGGGNGYTTTLFPEPSVGMNGWFNENKLYLFGASGNLWLYDINADQWTLKRPSMSGNEVFGARGIASQSNTPGKKGVGGGWKDKYGNFWLFGGRTAGIGFQVDNALWKYNPRTNQWVWVKGDSIAGRVGRYGIQGIANENNNPGARSEMVCWTDTSGNFWLFGGLGFGSTNTTGYNNDIWKYTPPVEAENNEPLVNISNPTEGATFLKGSYVTLNVEASDIDGTIKKVAFFNKGIKFGEDSVAPYSISDSVNITGNYILTALATDDKGIQTVSSPRTIIVNGIGTGLISVLGYQFIPGTQVADMLNHPSYPANPTVVAQLSKFEYLNAGENYGGVVRGYIHPPITGNYTFYIAGDDQAGLYLSSDENPGHKTLIAYNTSATGYRVWNKFSSQKSVPIPLVQGQKYYIETQHKQGCCVDHLSVRWVLPNGVSEAPIPGNRLTPFTVISGSTMQVQGFEESMFKKWKSLVETNEQPKISPNPSSGKFQVVLPNLPENLIEYQLTDAEGRLIESGRSPSKSILVVGTKILVPGVYSLFLKSGDKIYRSKLVRIK